MAVEVIMPKAGMAMEEGTVSKWLKKEGESVEAGEPLMEIETDKVNMEIESPASGVLLKILNEEGDVVPVTQVIAYIGKAGEKLPGADEPAKKEKSRPGGKETGMKEASAYEAVPKLSEGRAAATPLARRLAFEKGIDLKAVKGTGSRGEIKAGDIREADGVKATPLAARIAADKNIDLRNVRGSGFRGKIRKEDLEEEKPEAAKNFRLPEGSAGESARKPIKGMRKVIADKMLKSHLEIPPVTLHAKADVTGLAALRAKMNASPEIKISINDFVLKAVAMALAESPDINVSVSGNEIIFKSDINVGMAVALDGGLIVPVIKNTDLLSLRSISKVSKELAGKAKRGELTPDEYAGGTFTVSNLGMFDIVGFTPIINLPEAAILGVCAIEGELRMVEGKAEERSIMGLSLTFDHRAIDGAQAAVFLKKIKLLLQNPLEIVLGN